MYKDRFTHNIYTTISISRVSRCSHTVHRYHQISDASHEAIRKIAVDKILPLNYIADFVYLFVIILILALLKI